MMVFESEKPGLESTVCVVVTLAAFLGFMFCEIGVALLVGLLLELNEIM